MMSEENTKIRLTRKLSTRIASKMFPKYSRGVGYKQKWTNKKSLSRTSLSPAKSKASIVSVKEIKHDKHESKGSLRRSFSRRFSSFRKRQNLRFKEGGEKEKVNDREINVGNIGLKRQISSGLRRTLKRKHKSVTEFYRKRSSSNVNNGLTRKSLPDIRRIIPNKQFLNTHLQVSGKEFSIQLKSRLDSTAETIDLMEVAKPARIQTIIQNEQTTQSEKSTDNPMKIMSPLGMPEFIGSPTCADLFGVDEEENGFFFYSQSIEHIHKQSLKNGMDHGKDKSVVDIKTEKKERQFKKESDPFQRRSITSIDMCVPELEFDNPWVLQEHDTGDTPTVTVAMDKPRQTLLTPQISVDSLSCNSFGFTVSGLDVTCEEPVEVQMRRSDSRESIDSFSSSVHSVRSQELMFSDSEAEMDMDQISISSTDSGTFDNQQLSEKSFDSDVAPKNNEHGTASSGKTRIHGTPNAKARRRYGVSLEETADIAGKIARKLFGKQVSSDTAIETQQKVEKAEQSAKDTLLKRRSFDSNLKIQQMTLDLDSSAHARLKWTGSSDSGLSSALSPVFETGTTERKNVKNIGKIDDSQKYYTLPNRKKNKNNQSPKKKLSLERISKTLSEKAQSLSNLKLSSSFKIRNSDNEASKLQTFLKTNSWTNLVVKKGAEVASNISTLMRKRSHSNSLASSPFMPKARKSKKKQEQEEKIFVYEKVKLYRPKERPVSREDIVKWKKSMKLFVRIDQNRDSVSGLQSRTNSYRGLPAGSLRSPTLLDEIMKSVDRVRFRECRRSLADDCEVSDEEDSSCSSSPLLFTVKSGSETTAVNSGDTHSLGKNCTVCTNCGKIRYISQQNGMSFTSRKHLARNATRTISLCDLHSSCSCVKTQCLSRRKTSLVPNTRNNLRVDNTVNRSETNLYSRMTIGMDGMCNSLMSGKANRPTSMFELRNIEEVLYDTAEEDQYDGDPGTLFRSQVQHNLSDDNLDSITTATEATQSERNCHSCEDILSECTSRTRVVKTPEVLLSPVSQFSETPDDYHSCSEFLEAENCEGTDETDYKKSHSCGNLMDESDVFIGNKLKEEQELKDRKEIRKAKVKSLSSSHDALNSFVPIENLTIAKDIEDVVQDVERMFGEKARLGDELNESHTVHSTDKVECPDLTSVCDNGADIEDPVIICDSKCQKCDYKASTELSATDKTEPCQNCAICEKLREEDTIPNNKVPKHHKSFSDSLQVNEPTEDIGKPPLPGQKGKRKFLSMNDIHQNHGNVHTLEHTCTKTSPKTDSVPKTPTSPSLLCPDNVCVKTLGSDSSYSAPTTPYVNSHRASSYFNFHKPDIQTYSHTLTPPLHDQERLKSVSSDNMTSGQTFNNVHERSWSGYIKHTHSDDVFSQAYQAPISPGRALQGSANHVKEFSELSPFGVFTDVPGPDVETVFKYDVGLGYLLHSLECDNQLICFYSFQRNKQLMESVITPLAALPGVSGTKLTGTSNINKGQKHQNKSKCDNHPNPAAPITAVPSDKLAHAGRVIRTVLLTRAAHMIRDRKFHLRTYRRCMVGTEMVDWLIQQSPLVHSRTQAMGMWQALLEEGMVVHVCHEHQFKDEYLFYRFHEDDEGVSTVPTATTKRECEEDLQDVFLTLAQIGPDAMMRMILRKLPHERTMDDLEIIYEELLHIKALSHLSTMVKRELASVLVFESHTKSGTVLFNQGDEGKSWYIILKGSVNVVIYGKGVVCTLYEGDDFGKLALVNDAPRAATIVLRDDNCHFLRVDKDDFNRILRDVEANTVRLKEHGQDVLVLEKIPSNSQSSDGIVHTHYKYSVMAGTPEKMLEYLLESRLDSKKEDEIDGFLEDFLLTHVIFMPHNHLCPVLLSHYHSSMADTSEQEAYEISLNHKKCVLHFVKEWANTVGMAFKEDQTINAFLEELHSCILEDLSVYNTLKDDVVAMETILQEQNNSPECKSKRKISGNFSLTRKHSKENQSGENVIKCKPVKPSDETIFKVYCADHTYSTLKLPMDTTVEQLLYSTKEKLGLGDDLILCEVKSTGERVVFKENDLCVISGLSINGRLFITPKEHLDALTPLPEQEGPREGSFSTIEMMSSREMAYYMTMYDWELFTCVQEYELIYQVFGRYKFGKITANLDQFLQRFNEIQFWVITEMVLTTTLSKRVSLLRKFIKLASHCKEHQNLNSFFAIVMGLSNIAVSRLSQTWEKLPGKFKKLFAEFETLMDPSRNHRAYRLSVAKMVPPIIPFMPLLMKDMTFTHEGNKTYFDGLVNFEKMHMIAQTLKTVKFCRNAFLDLEVPGSMKSTDTSSYIRGLHVIDNQRLLTQLSHKVEPRKT